MKKKALFFAAILIFIVSVTCLSVSAQTYSGTCGANGDNLTWVLDDNGKLTISGEGEMEAWESSSLIPWDNYKKYIKEVHIEAGVTSIGFAAFADCNSLTNVTIPSSIKSIGAFSFLSCASLETITYGGSEISWSLMRKLSQWDRDIGNYEMIYLNEYTVIDGDSSTWKFDSEGVLTIYGTMQLGDWEDGNRPWLREEKYIKTIIIEDSVSAKIGKSAFAWCESLTNVVIGDGVTIIGEWAFYRCNMLSDVTIGDGVTSIGEWAFWLCESLENITLGNSVTNIGEHAFEGCSSLKTLVIPDSVITIEDSALSGCTSLESVTIGKNLAGPLYLTAPSLKNIDVDISNPNFTSVDGVLFNKEKTALICYPAGKTEKSYIVPDSVTCIDEGAFVHSDSLERISIPNSVTSIGDFSLYHCTLLETIYFYGTEDEWNQISKGESWDFEVGINTEKGTYTVIFLDAKASETTTAPDTTITPETTTAPETTAAPNSATNTTKKTGCGATVCSSIVIVSILGAAWVTKKR